MTDAVVITLADVDWAELVVYAIGAVIMVGGAVANYFKEMREKAQAARDREKQASDIHARQSATDRSGSKSPAQLSVEDRAARRRAQLQELARRRAAEQRGQGTAGAGTFPQRQAPLQQPPQASRSTRTAAAEASALRTPDNLRADEARRRAQAKAEYERRAALLRQRKQQQARQPQAAPVQSARQQRQPLSSLSSLEVAPEHGEIDAGRSVVHRHVPDAMTQVVSATQNPWVHRLRGQSLREAIVLREILDQPVAFRDPLEHTQY